MAATRRRGWRELEVYTDNSVSSGECARPAFTRILADAAAGRLEVVVAYHPDVLTSAVDFRQGEVS